MHAKGGYPSLYSCRRASYHAVTATLAAGVSVVDALRALSCMVSF